MLRLSEHYVSVQGEGPNTGTMTQFVRFAGCNMRCPGWPCDTPHAIFPELYRTDSEKLSWEDLVERILKMQNETGAYNICLTGGEPFLQPTALLYDLVGQCKREGLTVECFSNGSFAYPSWAIEEVQFIMDWKLAGSGEADHNRDVREHNAKLLTEEDCIKFVVADQADLVEAQHVYWTLFNDGVAAEFWVGAVWGRIPDRKIIEFVQQEKLPWRLNVQLHKYLYDPDKRGV